MASFCLARLGAPHAGHVALVEVLLAAPGPCLVVVGSADVEGRPDAPLPWAARRDLLAALAARRGVALDRVTFSPLPELRTDGWDDRWCAYLLDAARRGLGEAPRRYVHGDDYAPSTLAGLRAHAPALALVAVPRRFGKSGRDLRRAIVTGDPALARAYAEELAVYSADDRARIAAACAAGVDRP